MSRQTAVIESSSGNTAIGLAQLCAAAGLRLICVVDPRITPANLDLLRAYGAEIEMVSAPDPATAEYLPLRLGKVRELLARLPDAYWPDQYTNPSVISAHVEGTMREIAEALGKPPEYLYVAVSTCGTLLGCSEFIRTRQWPTRLIAVDVEGSRIFSGPEAARPRALPGMGAPFPPPFAARSAAWRTAYVSEADCIDGCRQFVRTCGMLVGASSGGITVAARRQIDAHPEELAMHVLILPDRGERYLDSVFKTRRRPGRAGNS